MLYKIFLILPVIIQFNDFENGQYNYLLQDELTEYNIAYNSTEYLGNIGQQIVVKVLAECENDLYHKKVCTALKLKVVEK